MARTYRGYSHETKGKFFSNMLKRPATNKTNNALLWGLAWLIITAIVGWFFRIMPTSSFGVITTDYVSLLNHVIVNLVVWITACAVPFLLAVVINHKTKMVELFGRMLFAHWPVVILMLPAIFGDKVAFSTYMSGLASFDFDVTFGCQMAYSIWMSILVLGVLVWYLYWSYLAFNAATCRGGVASFLLLMVAMSLSWWLSSVTLDSMVGTLI